VSDIEREIPLGRFAQPSEVAALVSWLAGPENSYVTGQNILIDGGLTRTAHP
jgi:NAD(P)-dependent dehydrogenase (short-subunit alcohol dehydrogenase family)